MVLEVCAIKNMLYFYSYQLAATKYPSGMRLLLLLLLLSYLKYIFKNTFLG